MHFCLDPGDVIPEAALTPAFDLDQCTHLPHQTSGNKRSSSHRGTGSAVSGIRHEAGGEEA